MSTIDPDLLSRRQRSAIPATYRAAIPARIADVRFYLTSEMAAEAEESGNAIARLDEYVASVLGEFDMSPLQSLLLRLESAASSQIENITVGAKQLAFAELGAAASSNADLVANNVDAMRAAVALVDELDAQSITSTHAALLSRSRPKIAGRWRDQPVWIGSSGLSPAGAAFVPPHHERVPDAIDDLVTFMRRDDIPVLVQAAIAHAHFETIHPFADGNGRTGRALLHALLKNKRLASRVTVPISSGLLGDTRGYFGALIAYRSGDAWPIIHAVCSAGLSAVRQGRWLVDEVNHIRGRWLEQLAPRSGSAGQRLVDLVISQPAVNVGFVVDRLGVSETAARRAIDQAVESGLLAEGSDRRRHRIWTAPDVLGILDEFAARSERRADG